MSGHLQYVADSDVNTTVPQVMALCFQDLQSAVFMNITCENHYNAVTQCLNNQGRFPKHNAGSICQEIETNQSQKERGKFTSLEKLFITSLFE